MSTLCHWMVDKSSIRFPAVIVSVAGSYNLWIWSNDRLAGTCQPLVFAQFILHTLLWFIWCFIMWCGLVSVIQSGLYTCHVQFHCHHIYVYLLHQPIQLNSFPMPTNNNDNIIEMTLFAQFYLNIEYIAVYRFFVIFFLDKHRKPLRRLHFSANWTFIDR